jgi:hypothetical protein
MSSPALAGSARAGATAGRPGHLPALLLGLVVAAMVVILLLFAGSEDRGFIYVDF